MNRLHAQKVQLVLERMVPHQRAFIAKFGTGEAPGGGTPQNYVAAFALAMMDAGRPLWEEGLAGVTGPLDLSGADFTAGTFAGVGEGLFKGANFKGAVLDRTRWIASEAKHADFSGASLKDSFTAVFMCEGSSFRGADLSGSTIRLIAENPPVDFTEANLSGVQFTIPYPISMIFTGANLEGARVITGEIGSQTKQGIDLFRASLSETQRRQVRIDVSDEALEKTQKAAAAARESKQGGCFIATAACGSERHLDVVRLRAFRDSVLTPSPAGRVLIALYERLSPPFADWIRSRERARRRVRRWLVSPAARLFGGRMTNAKNRT
jgi:hypothetical protein